ncbi:hypothetical protein K439DRAFT_1629818, partial [Ramaria rubella]
MEEKLLKAIAIIHAQRRKNIDKKLVAACEKQFKEVFGFVDNVSHHRNRRSMPTTCGKSGWVSKSLTGYRYSSRSQDKENDPV